MQCNLQLRTHCTKDMIRKNLYTTDKFSCPIWAQWLDTKLFWWILEATVYATGSSSPTSNQISQMLQLISPWLLISARSSRFLSLLSVQNLLLQWALVSDIATRFFWPWGTPDCMCMWVWVCVYVGIVYIKTDWGACTPRYTREDRHIVYVRQLCSYSQRQLYANTYACNPAYVTVHVHACACTYWYVITWKA